MRSWQSLGGPWALLGASQWNQPATLASASLGGVWLTSFLIAAANTAIAGAILHRDSAGPGRRMAVAVVCAVSARRGSCWDRHLRSARRYGWRWCSQATSRTRRPVGQAGEALTESLAGQHLDLVVWGESSVGVDLTSDPDVMTDLTDLSRRLDAYLLVNVDAPAPAGGIYKSSVLIGPDGPLGSYKNTTGAVR